MATIKTKVEANVALPSGVHVTITETKSLASTTKLSTNFTLSELANNKATESPKFLINSMVIQHIRMLQELRNSIGVCNVSSGFRCPKFNKKCGGDANSLHLDGLATDIKFPKLSEAKYAIIEECWRKICDKYNVVGGINRYTNGVHVDSNEAKFGATKFVTRDYRGTKKDW